MYNRCSDRSVGTSHDMYGMQCVVYAVMRMYAHAYTSTIIHMHILTACSNNIISEHNHKHNTTHNCYVHTCYES